MSMSEGDHIDQYTFIDHFDAGKRPDDVLREIFDGNPDTVRFTALFTGPFLGFVACRLPSLAEGHELANGAFWDAGLRCESAVIVMYGMAIPKRGSPDVCAIIRARSGDPEGTLQALDETFRSRYEAEEGKNYEDRDFNYGAAVVNGTYELLIDIGATTLPKTIRLVNEVRSVPGIDRTVTAFAHLPGNARRRDI